MQVTPQQLAQAFEAWEHNFRAEPASFLTGEECAAIGVSKLSADRAAHLMGLLIEQQIQDLARHPRVAQAINQAFSDAWMPKGDGK